MYVSVWYISHMVPLSFFRFLRNPLSDFHSSFISLYSHLQCFRTSLSQLLARNCCHSIWSKMKSQSCLICILQRAEDIEHLKILFWRPWVITLRLREQPNYPDDLSTVFSTHDRWLITVHDFCCRRSKTHFRLLQSTTHTGYTYHTNTDGHINKNKSLEKKLS